MDNYEYMEKVYKLEQKAFHLDIEGWYLNEIFTCRWWVLLAFLIVPWLIWAKVAFRTKLLESILFGALIAIITVYLDVLGVKLNFWDYPTQLFPIMPRGISFDMSMVPVAFMMVYQYFTSWKKYTMALIIIAALFAFVCEPMSIWLDLVIYYKWHYLYSFVYYIATGIFVRWIVISVSFRYSK